MNASEIAHVRYMLEAHRRNLAHIERQIETYDPQEALRTLRRLADAEREKVAEMTQRLRSR